MEGKERRGRKAGKRGDTNNEQRTRAYSVYLNGLLETSSHLCKKVCPIVRPSFLPSFHPFVSPSIRHAFVKKTGISIFSSKCQKRLTRPTRRSDGQTNRRTSGAMTGGAMDRRTDGRTDRRSDGRTDSRTHSP